MNQFDSLSNAAFLRLICDRHDQAFKDSNDDSTRLSATKDSKRRPKYLFSVVELLFSLRNVHQHMQKQKQISSDIGSFVRKNYPFLLSHVWHVRAHVETHACMHAWGCGSLATRTARANAFLRPYSAQVLRFFKDELSAKVPELHRAVWDN